MLASALFCSHRKSVLHTLNMWLKIQELQWPAKGTKAPEQISERHNCPTVHLVVWLCAYHINVSLGIHYSISHIATWLPPSFTTADKGNFPKTTWGSSTQSAFPSSPHKLWHVCKHTWMYRCQFPHACLIHDGCALKMWAKTPETNPVLNCVCDSQPSCRFETCQTHNSAPATSSWFIPLHFHPSISCTSISPFPVNVLQP